MSDAESLFALLAVVYVIDCAQWAPLDSVVFSAPWGNAFRARFPHFALGNGRGALVLANPLPPLGPAAITQPSPLSFSPEGVAAFPAQTLNTHAIC